MKAQLLSALGEPNRLHIVELLTEGPHSVGEIVERLHISQPLASKHLGILGSAGIVEVQRSAQKRIYSLRPKPFREMDSWLSEFRKLWEDRLDRLESHLKQMQQEEKDNGKEKTSKGKK